MHFADDNALIAGSNVSGEAEFNQAQCRYSIVSTLFLFRSI